MGRGLIQGDPLSTFLVIMVKVLNKLLLKATDLGLFEDLNAGCKMHAYHPFAVCRRYFDNL